MLTKKDQSFIDGAVRSARDAFRLMRRDNSSAQQIAAVRWLLAENTRAEQLQRTGQLVLCKLIELYPTAAQEYIVQRDRSAFEHPVLSRLLSAYSHAYGNNGPGSWAIVDHEAALLGVYVLTTGMWNTTVIHRTSLRGLIAAYVQQEATSRVIAPATDMRARLASDIAEQSTTSVDRKRAARDAMGTCYLCSAPKARGTACAVCGYIPRGSAR